MITKTDNKRIERLWEAGKSIWGSAFIEKHGEQPCKLWEQQLTEFSDENIREALKKIKADKANTSPPSLLDFILLCKTHKKYYKEKPITQPVQTGDIEKFKEKLTKHVMMSFVSVETALSIAKENALHFIVLREHEKHGNVMRFALKNFSSGIVEKKYNNESFKEFIKIADKYAENIGVKLNYSLIEEFLLESNT